MGFSLSLTKCTGLPTKDEIVKDDLKPGNMTTPSLIILGCGF